MPGNEEQWPAEVRDQQERPCHGLPPAYPHQAGASTHLASWPVQVLAAPLRSIDEQKCPILQKSASAFRRRRGSSRRVSST